MAAPGARVNVVATSLRLGILVLAMVSFIPQAFAGDRGGRRSFAAKLSRGPGVSNHPIGVRPSSDVSIPKGWPLAADGTIKCLTCHAALPSMRGDTGPKLRDFDDRLEGSTAFCMKCHVDQGRQNASTMHWTAVRVAHVRSDDDDRMAGRRGVLDGESRECLTCHDGVNAAESQNVTGRGGGFSYVGNRTGNHPVGIRYPRAGRSGSGSPMRPASMLPAEVRLPGGAVSCVSCHDLYARDRHLLSVRLDDSELCFTCHDMD